MADTHPVIEQLHVENYRVLRDVTFKKLEPLTVLFGPNGSGKSTVFDVFAFLYDAMSQGLRKACDDRNGVGQIRSKGRKEPIIIELKYRQSQGERLITYRLEIEDNAGRPVVGRERLDWSTSPGSGRPRHIVDLTRGSGNVYDDDEGKSKEERLESPDVLAVSALGQLSRHPNVAALRRFITGWYLSYISADQTRTTPSIGPSEQLSRTGDNLPNVLQYLQENDAERLDRIFDAMRARVPQLDRLTAQSLPDGRLMLQLKDRPFSEPVLSRFASDGTLKLLAYLTVLYSANPPPIIGIEEPENQLHPKLLTALAEELRVASVLSQVFVTTHSPYLVDAMSGKEVWLLHRGVDGFARAVRADSVDQINHMMATGGKLGDLWMEGYFPNADPTAGP